MSSVGRYVMLNEVTAAIRSGTPGVVRGGLHDPWFMSTYAEAMHRLRYQVFHQRLGWDVTVCDGLERDRFDNDHAVYMVTTDVTNVLSGGWRLLPTTRDYMLGAVFPQLLRGECPPCDRRIWEISRFAVDTKERAETAAFSLGETAGLLLVDAVRFAIENNITRYILVTSVAVERLLAGTGILVHRFGPPLRIGRVMSVACWVDIDVHTRHVLLGAPPADRMAA